MKTQLDMLFELERLLLVTFDGLKQVVPLDLQPFNETASHEYFRVAIVQACAIFPQVLHASRLGAASDGSHVHLIYPFVVAVMQRPHLNDASGQDGPEVLLAAELALLTLLHEMLQFDLYR